MEKKENDVIDSLKLKIREKLKGDENWGVESQTMFANNNFHYRFDLIIKYKDDVQAIFELKTGIKSIKSEIKRAIIKQCGLYRESFPQSSPFVFVTDGNDFHEVSEDKPYDWGEGEDIDKVIERVLGRNNNSEIPKYKSFINKLKESTKKEVQEFAREIEEGNTESYFDMNLKTFSFTPEYERKFFGALLGEARNELYRYTSFEAIKRIMSEDKQSMASLIGMTDFTECYYADDYIKKKVQMDVKEKGKVYSDACKCFIVSCTNNEDENLKMWEDYGDKFKGVRISYCYEKLNKSDKFQIAKVSYASSYNKHPELDFIAEIQQNYGKHSFKINEWDVWQHFFKPYDYRNENETRILFYLKDDYKIKTDAWKWINKDGKFFPILSFEIEKFPYVISEIMLGRVGKDTFERNKAVLEQMLSVYKKEKNIKIVSSRYLNFEDENKTS